MKSEVINNTSSGRIEFTAGELERLRLAARKFGREKLDRIIANHPPEYWENYWKAMEERRAGIRQERICGNRS
ncbi:hypothetical protein SAMN05216327_101141 [Dyadobacter sp. SG02]|uniref:hypothetical protein n=1 Tax=Dyadobacter sp. SG02 TaxID=1855291 RepID=UPI0008D8018B|nr:hypothetical protein [Dyadobacter sp. SG02]SEI38815.1 hypothetical protein SAMN05216327_101141 [Dyadobacter sp. SG02]